MPPEHTIQTDVLIIGGATAGCFAAITARKQGLDVTIVDKGYAGKSGASIVASGWWNVFNSDWGMDFDESMKTINHNGEYLNNRTWTEIMLKESWSTYEDLRDWGVDFPAEHDEMKDYFRKEIIRSAERERRQAHSEPFGWIPLRHRQVTPVLRKQAAKSGAKVFDRIMITDLLKQDERVVGALGFSLDHGELYVFRAKATILSAGSNYFRPPGFHTSAVTGDADAMAYRAGAEITGKEFPDMHFNLAKHPAWNGTRGLYPAFFYFTDANGNLVPAMAHDLAMVSAIDAGKGPLIWDLDAAGPDDVEAMRAYVRKRANPVEIERIGLGPAAGGKWPIIGGSAGGGAEEQTAGVWPTNSQCASSVPGLFAAGDCCGTWCWGSIVAGLPWGLMPAAVTGKRAGAGAAECALQLEYPAAVDDQYLAELRRALFEPALRTGGFSPRWVTQLLQNTMMPYYVLHIKHDERLRAALTTVEFLRDRLVPSLRAKDAHELRLAHETKNMVLNAEMILRSSLFRCESRGRHYREDYPQKDDPNWLAWVKLKSASDGMRLMKEPIPKEWWPDMSKPVEERYIARWLATREPQDPGTAQPVSLG